MARDEADREDLIAEATALVPRVEIAWTQGTMIVGFRNDGAMSCYFDSEPVYHFNVRRHLRRAYLEGQLIKAERGKLVAMRRQRADREVQLRSKPLGDDAERELLAELKHTLLAAADELEQQAAYVTRSITEPGDPRVAHIEAFLIEQLRNAAAKVEIANRPNL